MKFKVLGSLVLESDTGPLEVAGKQEKGAPPTTSHLGQPSGFRWPPPRRPLGGVPATWGESRPWRVMSRCLRQVIGRDRIARRAGGYALVVDQWALDSICFQREAEAGQRALGAGRCESSLQPLFKGLGSVERTSSPRCGRMTWAQVK